MTFKGLEDFFERYEVSTMLPSCCFRLEIKAVPFFRIKPREVFSCLLQGFSQQLRYAFRRKSDRFISTRLKEIAFAFVRN